MVEIRNRNGGPRAKVVVHVIIKQPISARIAMSLKIPSHPVVAVSEAIRKQLAPGIEEKARSFCSRAGHYNQVCGLLLECILGSRNRPRP